MQTQDITIQLLVLGQEVLNWAARGENFPAVITIAVETAIIVVLYVALVATRGGFKKKIQKATAEKRKLEERMVGIEKRMAVVLSDGDRE